MLSFVSFHYLVSWRTAVVWFLFSFSTPLMSQRRFPFSFDLRWSVKMSNINQNFKKKKKRKCVYTICAISQTGTPALKQWLNQWCDVVWLELKLTFTARPAFPAPPMKRHRLTGVNAQREREEEPAMRGTGSGLLLLLQQLFWMAQLIWIGPDKLSPAGAERARFSLSLSVGRYAVTIKYKLDADWETTMWDPGQHLEKLTDSKTLRCENGPTSVIKTGSILWKITFADIFQK